MAAANNPDPTYYEILGVSEDASAEEIEKAFKVARRDSHPHKGAPEWAFRQVSKAYETLKEPGSRALYDQKLKHGDAPPAPAPQPDPPKPPSSAPTQSQTPSKASAATSRETVDSVYGSTASAPAKAPVEVPDFVVVDDNENNTTELEDYAFSPSHVQSLPQMLAGVVGVLAGFGLMALAWAFPTYPVTIGGAAAVLGLIAIAMQLRREVDKNANKITLVTGLLAVILVAVPLGVFMASPLDNPLYLTGFLLLVIGTLVGGFFASKFALTLKLNKQIPVKLLRNARIFGEPTGLSPAIAAIIRNVATALGQTVRSVDGTFMMHVRGLHANNQEAPIDMVLINGNKAALVSLLNGAAGQYSVDNTGNIVHQYDRGIGHLPNENPKTLAVAQTLEKKFPTLKTKSFVIIIPSTAGKIFSFDSERTAVSDRNHGVRLLKEYFKDGDKVVRRDVLSEFARYVTS